MISESHSDWNRWPERSRPPLPLEVVRQLAVVHDGDVLERIGPVGVRARDVDVGLGRHAHVADRMRATEVVELVLGANRVRRRGPDDLERAADREHLRVGDVLDPVGQVLRVAVVGERHAVCVLRLLVVLADVGAGGLQPAKDAALVAFEPLVELEVTRGVRVGQRVAHDGEAVVGEP